MTVKCLFSCALVLAFALLAGCAARGPATYRLVAASSEPMLFPPRVVAAVQETVVDIPEVKRRGRGPCAVNAGELKFEWARQHARVRLPRLGTMPGDRVPVDVLDSFSQLRAALAVLEASGCIAPGDADNLLARLVERAPMPPVYAYYIRHGAYPHSGFIDLSPSFRLKLIRPVTTSAGVSDFETLLYSVDRRPQGGLRIVAGAQQGSAQELFPIPAWATGFRLFFLTRLSAADNDSTLLAVRDVRLLEERTVAFQKNPTAYCSAPGPDAVCLTVPRNVALSAELMVRSKEREVWLPLGGSVGDVLRAARVDPKTVIPKLAVLRPYGGRLIPVEFDRQTTAVLNMVLIGGEELSW